MSKSLLSDIIANEIKKTKNNTEKDRELNINSYIGYYLYKEDRLLGIVESIDIDVIGDPEYPNDPYFLTVTLKGGSVIRIKAEPALEDGTLDHVKLFEELEHRTFESPWSDTPVNFYISSTKGGSKKSKRKTTRRKRSSKRKSNRRKKSTLTSKN
jgi:hypothetical protein